MRADDSITRFEMVPYFHGRVLEFSEGRVKAFPHFIWYQDVRLDEPDELRMFSTQSFDSVVSSHLLHLMPLDRVRSSIKEWSRVVKMGGHIVLHLPETGGQWDTSYEGVTKLMHELVSGWDLVQYTELESGLLYAFRIGPMLQREFTWRLKPDKTCAVVRLGAYGDCVQASSILPWLKEQGYHVTFYCSDHGQPVLAHDPHVDRFIIQGRDEVPPQVLGDFWDYERKKYDKWVNLSESVEATLLAAPGHSNFGWPNGLRAKLMDRNYLEFTHELAEVPPPYRPKFYATDKEKEWAKSQARKMGLRNVLWSLSGSSVHKTWPHLDAIIARLLLSYGDVHVVLVGDEVCAILEAGWQAEKRVHCLSGKWTIRQSMAFCEEADLIIGCETGLLNAAGSMETPKIVMLSHSSEEMLTKHWKNTISLTQRGGGCPMQPCRMMHNDWSTCNKYEDETTTAAMCMYHIGVEQAWEAVTQVMGEPAVDFDRKVA